MQSLPIPEGFHSVNCHLTIEGADQVIEFFQQTFGAIEVGHKSTYPNGKIMHAQVRIGDSIVMLGEAGDQWGPKPATLYVYVDDVDAVYRRALQAGAKSLREPQDAFYGDRGAGVEDSAGNQWWIATHIADVAPEEIERRFAAVGHKH